LTRKKVGFLAAKVRDMRPPEPYKGKGILYAGEKILRKLVKLVNNLIYIYIYHFYEKRITKDLFATKKTIS
jgi:hypothetical protein